jgi:hypothetical protein
MSEVRLGSHKVMREVVGSVLGQEKNLQLIKNEFSLEIYKGGCNSPWRALHKDENQEKGRKECDVPSPRLGQQGVT